MMLRILCLALVVLAPSASRAATFTAFLYGGPVSIFDFERSADIVGSSEGSSFSFGAPIDPSGVTYDADFHFGFSFKQTLRNIGDTGVRLFLGADFGAEIAKRADTPDGDRSHGWARLTYYLQPIRAIPVGAPEDLLETARPRSVSGSGFVSVTARGDDYDDFLETPFLILLLPPGESVTFFMSGDAGARFVDPAAVPAPGALALLATALAAGATLSRRRRTR